MSFKTFLIILACGFLVFAILQKISKNKKPLRGAFLSMLSGGGALALVDIASLFTGVYIPLSLLSILVSLVGGVPGVCAVLALNMFF